MNPPNESINPARVSPVELNAEWDNNHWEERLSSITPNEYYTHPSPNDLGYPKGTVTHGYWYKDADGTTIALVHRFITPKGDYCGERKDHPQMLLIDGVPTYC